MEKTAVMLTTIDNPFNPFTQWDEWRRFDEDNKYYSCNYLARIAKTSDDLPDEANEEIISDAIDEIVSMNINGMYRKVFEKNSDTPGG